MVHFLYELCLPLIRVTDMEEALGLPSLPSLVAVLSCLRILRTEKLQESAT